MAGPSCLLLTAGDGRAFWEGPGQGECPGRTQRVPSVPLAADVGGRAVTLAKWPRAQSGKLPSWKMVCAQVLMARLSSRTPIRFIRKPARTWNRAQTRDPTCGWKTPSVLRPNPARQMPKTLPPSHCPRLSLKEPQMSPFSEWFLGARYCALQLSQGRLNLRATPGLLLLLFPLYRSWQMQSHTTRK